MEYVLEAIEALTNAANLAAVPKPGEIGKLRADAFCAKTKLRIGLPDLTRERGEESEAVTLGDVVATVLGMGGYECVGPDGDYGSGMEPGGDYLRRDEVVAELRRLFAEQEA